MPHSAAHDRYRSEAEHALSRIKHYREVGDAQRVEQWHRTWSLAATAADAEFSEKGGGARVLRMKNPPPLRPLPADLPPLSSGQAPLPDLCAGALPAVPPALDSLTLAIARHDRIEQALLAGSRNPLPEELSQTEWKEQLLAYQEGGPLECPLLQDAESAVEALMEMLPELFEEGEEFFEPTQDGCLRIYQESLGELTEDELRADLATCLDAGRRDTAALIEVEISRRERETAPDLESIYAQLAPGREKDDTPARSKVAEPERPELPEDLQLSNTSDTEPAPPGYTTAPAWVDTAGRTRTWSLFDPAGGKMAEIATKRDAEKLADLFNRLLRGEARFPS